MVFALFPLVSLPSQTAWLARAQLFAQPAFWPGVAVILMVIFSGPHLIGALVSGRIPGRLAEVIEWFKAIKFALWVRAYVRAVPVVGYLLATLVFTMLLTFRLDCRGWHWMLSAALFGVLVVVVFKSLLHLRIPEGDLYDYLPSGPFGTFMMSYL